MGNNSFAPGSRNPNSFEVMNITSPPKTIFIFNYPINFGSTRNLMAIPGVATDDIRSSLLKGTINNKLRAGEITIINSDIDLLEFNSTQLAFEQNAGITVGLQVTSFNRGIRKLTDVDLVGAVDDVNRVFTIPQGTFIHTTFIQNPPPYVITVYISGVVKTLFDDYFIAASYGGDKYDTVIFNAPPPLESIITADYYIR
jgi:hypothetical protein